jgi:gamma-glutamyl-gamma-aminobutyrate hydrolase PuuD
MKIIVSKDLSKKIAVSNHMQTGKEESNSHEMNLEEEQKLVSFLCSSHTVVLILSPHS